MCNYNTSLNHKIRFTIFVFMQQQLFKLLAKLNKAILPSFTKQRLDLSKATKLQIAIFGWRLYVTKRALN